MPRLLTLIILLILAAGWLIPDYMARMWRAGHYQFFPLVFLAVGGLLYSRADQLARSATTPRNLYVTLGFSAVVSLLALGHLLSSNFLGLLGLIAALITGLYAVWGRGALWRAAPILCLLIFAIPLPLNWDQSLIVEMQFLASGLASKLLDGTGVVHFREGVVLQTEQSRFLTEEACSGIRSLFSSLFVVAATCLWLELAWPRTVINLLQTMVWVVLGNAIRVAAVVLLADHVSPWFATGLGHELLGLSVFAFILAMVYSTDQTIGLLMHWWLKPPIDAKLKEELARARGVEIVKQSGIGFQPVKSKPASQPVKSEPVKSDPASQPNPSSMTGWKPIPRLQYIIICTMLILVAGIGGRVAWVRGSGLEAFNLRQIPQLPHMVEADMPREIGGWQRASFEHVQRDHGGLLAEHSYIWTYRSGELTAKFSVDRPWAEWHNLNYCYLGLGWQTEPDYFITAAAETLSHSELELRRGAQQGFVLYCAVDRNGKEVAPSWRFANAKPSSLPLALIIQAGQSLGLGVRSNFALRGQDLPASTLQVYSERPAYTDQQKEAIRAFYFEARHAYLEVSRE